MDVLIFGILRYLTKQTCKSAHIIICSFREWVSWSKYCFLIDYLSFPLGILPQWSRSRATYLLTSRLSPWENKQTNKQTNTLAQILRNPFFLNFHAYYSRRKKNWRHCLRLHNFVWGRRGAGTNKYSWTPLFRSPKGNGKKFEIAGFRNNRGSVKFVTRIIF